MKEQQNIFTIEMQEGQSCTLQSIKENDGIAEYEFLFSWKEENAAADDGFTVSWMEPYVNGMYKWDGCNGVNKYMFVSANMQSMISKDAPIICFFDGKDTNTYCWTLSEGKQLVELGNWIEALQGNIVSSFSFRTAQYTNQYTTTVTLRVDKRAISMRRVIEDQADWWCDACGIIPAHVPSAAKDPLYSTWYSYARDIDAKCVEEECRRASDLGFEVCIVDDGWQTDDSSSYGYCGDWEPSPTKFPDMAAHVKRVQDMGMKYVMWYSVPFLGYHSKNYEHFRSMTLRGAENDPMEAAILDPRYKEVREFLLNTYKRGLLEWNLDGFKLDFIDQWCEDPDNAPYNEKMDIPVLQDAVDVCMSEIMRQLTEIKPELLIEFRQRYIGPHMKHFGNMFRVSDCPGEYLYNRTAILDLRMFMGDQAVHSDMLMMAAHEPAEKNALQIISCMFGVLQYSGRLDLLPQKTKDMSRFWLSFLKEHKDLLQSRNLKSYDTHLNYTWAMTTEGDECAVGVYDIDKCIRPDAVNTIYIANGCMSERVLLELTGSYEVQTLDCYGQEVSRMSRDFVGFDQLPVPVGGLLILKKQ